MKVVIDFKKIDKIEGRKAKPSKYFNHIKSKYQDIKTVIADTKDENLLQVKEALPEISFSIKDMKLSFDDDIIPLLENVASNFDDVRYTWLQNLASQLKVCKASAGLGGTRTSKSLRW